MRGLKSNIKTISLKTVVVALPVSAWIEIIKGNFKYNQQKSVALPVSAWIEISTWTSLQTTTPVALPVSAWIEMSSPSPINSKVGLGRTPRECVD